MVVAFVTTADNWVLNYLAAPDLLAEIKLFSIGHAFELYLKAVYIHLTGNTKAAIKLGHHLSELWSACKGLDAHFLPSFVLQESHFKADVLGRGIDTDGLSGDKLQHVIRYQEIYVVMNHLADLKYIGVPLKSTLGQTQFGFAFPNEIWSQILGEIRMYLGITAPSNYLQYALDERMTQVIQLNASARHFLEHLVRPSDQAAEE